jgi:hypothetical protein
VKRAAALMLLALAGCGGSNPPPEVSDAETRLQLDRFFLRFRQRVQDNKTDSLAADLSRETLAWIQDIRDAARNEPLNFLRDRSFSQALCILALRVERRMRPDFDDRPAGILEKLVVQNPPVRKTLLKTDLGEPRVRGNAGEMGLREAPNVPVFFFTRENGAWKFHLAKSLPLILQGAESLARQRRPTPLEQAEFILEKFGGRTVLPEDLDR